MLNPLTCGSVQSISMDNAGAMSLSDTSKQRRWPLEYFD